MMGFLTIETIDGLIAVRTVLTNDVWLFDDAKDARLFVDSYFSEDICGIIRATTKPTGGGFLYQYDQIF